MTPPPTTAAPTGFDALVAKFDNCEKVFSIKPLILDDALFKLEIPNFSPTQVIPLPTKDKILDNDDDALPKIPTNHFPIEVFFK